MEPTQGPVTYVIETVVWSVTERFKREYKAEYHNTPIYEEVSMGWFVHFEGSHEALYLGNEEPALERGDKVRITICRA